MTPSVKSATHLEPQAHSRMPCRTTLAIFLPVCILALTAKLALSLTTYGSNDMLTWEADLRKVQADQSLALYRDGSIPVWHGKPFNAEPFNHPPFMIHVLQAWGAASNVTGLPLRVWLRATCALADFAMFWLVWGILEAEGLPVRLPMLFLLAVSPVSILVSGFHGNTDPILMLFVVLSVYLIAAGRPVWLAGAALGMALNVKVVPVIFLPAILLYLATSRRRVEYCLAAAVVFLAGSVPYLIQDPWLVIRGVFGYQPVRGYWGLPEIADLISRQALTVYLAIGKPVALCGVLLASLWVHFREPRTSLFLPCGFIAFLFLFLTSGFGPQYLAWIVPWWVALPWKNVRFHYTAAAAYIIAFYAVWSRGGWYMANANPMTNPNAPPGLLWLILVQVACWISVGLVVLAYGRQLQMKLRQSGSELSNLVPQNINLQKRQN